MRSANRVVIRNYFLAALLCGVLAPWQTAGAASVDAQICASATILSQDPGLEIYGFPEICVSLSGNAVATLPGDTVTFEDTRIDYTAVGGTNYATNTTSYFTVRFDWNWSINTSTSGPNETASALVWFDLFPGLEYTTGSGSDYREMTITEYGGPVPVAIDWFLELGASGSAVSTALVPLPGAVWLFISGLLGLTGINRILVSTRRTRAKT
jgi:hypothetical protein